MKHTKGKWHQRKLFETPIKVVEEESGRSWLSNSIAIHGDDKRTICDVHFMTNTENQGYGNNDTLELFEANADVITKVPEMIEALKWAYEVLSRVDHSYTERNTPEGQMKLSNMRFILKEIKS